MWELVDALSWYRQLGYTITPPEQEEGKEKANIQEQNKALILRANEELLNKGNLDFADEVFAADHVEGIKKFVTALRTAFPDLHVSVDLVIAEGDMVAWRRTHTGTHQGKYMGVAPTGKSVTWRVMVTSHIVNGKIVEEWGIEDLREQLGK
jgi:predicted ester cyclase